MKRILIVGDSFMKPDPRYPGRHFSEMLGATEPVILSQDGSSIGMILDQIIQGLDLEPDGMIIGFSAQDRLEWLSDDGGERKWIPSGASGLLTEAQQSLDMQFRGQLDACMSDIKAYAMAAGIMTMLSHKKISFAWTSNLLHLNPQHPYYWTLESMLAPFVHCKTPTNFTRYGKFVSSPGFHVDDAEWQKRFAQECLEILSRQG